jgi:hypothetical protein
LDFSDRFTSQFFTSLAHKFSAVNALIEKFRITDTIDVTNAKVMSFISELWVKIQRAGPKVNVERTAAKQPEQAVFRLAADALFHHSNLGLTDMVREIAVGRVGAIQHQKRVTWLQSHHLKTAKHR